MGTENPDYHAAFARAVRRVAPDVSGTVPAQA